ncbi:MAG: hypothetical protein V2A77_00685 [Pseudomonadota bacterium]
MSFPNYIGSHKRLWTKNHVAEALGRAAAELQGPLPCCDSAYNRLKTGRLDWPTSHRVLEYWGSMARGWLAAGASYDRVTLSNVDWTSDEDEYLLEHAGELTLAKIAKELNRSYQAVRARLSKVHHTTARTNQGHLSAAELAKEYNCSCHRIRAALRSGKLPGKYDRCRNRWQVFLEDLTPEMEAFLRRPKDTYKTSETDVGDYYRRYGIHRKLVNGRIVRIETAAILKP